MTKLWQKHWTLDRAVEAFETRDDLAVDSLLVRADVMGSLSHAYGLTHIGILTHDELALVGHGLLEILDAHEHGAFQLVAGDEDVHTKIENTLTARYGEVGKKLHTGRSRNDQVLTAIRLYTKEELLDIGKKLLALIQDFLVFAKTHAQMPMPGYTHMQKAMPSSVGMWAGSYAEALLDAMNSLSNAYDRNDQSPLGSAAAYGVPISLDRAYTAKLLGFARVQQNSLYCQNSRGVIEASVVSSLVTILQVLSKFASDVLLFTTSEFNLFSVDNELCSGSSIMPQKRNVDVAELIRSKVHIVLGHYIALVSLSGHLTSGYHRDFQDTKKPLFESLKTTGETVSAAHRLLLGLKPNESVLRRSMTSELFAAHRAFAQVAKGIPFREAYQNEGKNAAYSSAVESDMLSSILAASTHIGGTGNLGLAVNATRLRTKEKSWKRKEKIYADAISRLLRETGTVMAK